MSDDIMKLFDQTLRDVVAREDKRKARTRRAATTIAVARSARKPKMQTKRTATFVARALFIDRFHCKCGSIHCSQWRHSDKIYLKIATHAYAGSAAGWKYIPIPDDIARHEYENLPMQFSYNEIKVSNCPDCFGTAQAPDETMQRMMRRSPIRFKRVGREIVLDLPNFVQHTCLWTTNLPAKLEDFRYVIR